LFAKLFQTKKDLPNKGERNRCEEKFRRLAWSDCLTQHIEGEYLPEDLARERDDGAYDTSAEDKEQNF